MTTSETASRELHSLIYVNAFIVGIVLMSLEMIGSRYLNPYFGSSIYVWASLISTVLMALTAGYFWGGKLADRIPSAIILGIVILIAAYYTVLIPAFFHQLFLLIYSILPDVRFGSLIASLCLLFIPLALLGTYTPFAIRMVLRYSSQAGSTSGKIYGISTIGNVVGTLFTTFYLIPLFGTRLITFLLSAVTFFCALSFLQPAFLDTEQHTNSGIRPLLARMMARRTTALIIFFLLYILFLAAALYFSGAAQNIRNITYELSHPDAYKDGYLVYKAQDSQDKADKSVHRIESSHEESIPSILEIIESEYNTIYIYKNREYVTLKFFRYGSWFSESTSNTLDDAELPLVYARIMLVSLLYPDNFSDLLLVGLGGGTLTNYLHKFLKNDTTIRAVEIDGGVINAARKYFHTRESEHYRIVENDGRLHLHDTNEKYDIILLDAYHGIYTPFHLLTKEFFTLAKSRLKEGGCVAMNLHRNSKLFESIVTTVRAVFTNVDIYQSQATGAVAVAYDGERKETGMMHAKAKNLQQKYNLTYDLEKIYALRYEENNFDASVLTDDFSPANYLESIRRHNLN